MACMRYPKREKNDSLLDNKKLLKGKLWKALYKNIFNKYPIGGGYFDTSRITVIVCNWFCGKNVNAFAPENKTIYKSLIIHTKNKTRNDQRIFPIRESLHWNILNFSSISKWSSIHRSKSKKSNHCINFFFGRLNISCIQDLFCALIINSILKF